MFHINSNLFIILFIKLIIVEYGLTSYSQGTDYNTEFKSLSSSELWQIYKQKMDKSYEDKSEDSYRRKIWLENYDYIKTHNDLVKSGKKDFYLDVNPFCDMTQEEISKAKFGLKLSFDQKLKLSALNNMTQHNEIRTRRSSSKNLPESLNWVRNGVVSEIKDQGTCGACWSFVTTGALEAHQRIKQKDIKNTYSEQNLIDCSVSYGNEGCDGGLMSQAFEYIIDNNGIDSDSTYKYSGKIDTCSYSKGESKVQVASYQKLPTNENALKKAIATVGPVAVGIDANHKSFLLYKGGIYEEPACSSSDLNHAVLVVGYGTLNKKDYWLVKNSWGKKWGESGYAKIARNKKNHCGIASLAGYPILK